MWQYIMILVVILMIITKIKSIKELFMNIKDRMIIEEYREEKIYFEKIEEVVAQKLKGICKDAGAYVNAIQYRIKEEKSLEGKLYRGGDKYQKLSDLTDILGARVITYFGDDVDKIGKLIEENFEIDQENSTDKRQVIKADAFGYLSLHYIASLKAEDGYDENMCSKKFEIQIRTILQHAWSDINHDIGYKNDFGVPREVARTFARIAGVLEIADAEFLRVRDLMKEFGRVTREKIINDDAQDVQINLISLKEYMLLNKNVRIFLQEIADIEESEIYETNPENYIAQLSFLGIDTIGKIQDMLRESHDVALALAKKVLTGSELDILSSNIALRFICNAHMAMNDYSEEKMAEFFLLTSNKNDRATRQAKHLIKMYQNL